MTKKYDIHSFIGGEALNENFLKNKIREKWNEIFSNRSIPLKRKKKKFKEQFIKFIKNEILSKYPFSLQCKLLKIYECYEKKLESFAKTKLRIGAYYPEIPTAKEIYEELFLQNNNKIDFKKKLKSKIFENLLKLVNISNNLNDVNISSYSTLIEITFKFKKPYLSKDDDDFYIIDNPVVKDKVFKLPMIRPTTWKGALRFSAIKVFEKEFNESNWKEKRALLVRLFGNEKEALEDYLNEFIARKLKKDRNYVKDEFKKYLIEKGFISKDIPSRAGRLFFYPTFFDEISLDVITPLSRKTRTPARGPIYFEIVPERAKGIFRLLYYPFDLVAKGVFDKIGKEIKEDLEFLTKAIRKMFYEVGFSAKKTSGFGTAEVIDVKVLCGNKLKECESPIQKIFEKLKEGGS